MRERLKVSTTQKKVLEHARWKDAHEQEESADPARLSKTWVSASVLLVFGFVTLHRFLVPLGLNFFTCNSMERKNGHLLGVL